MPDREKCFNVYTHCADDPDNDGRVYIFTAWYCKRCGEWHLEAGTETSVLPWLMGTLRYEKLKEIPEEGSALCYTERAKESHNESTQTQGTKDHDEGAGGLG